MSAFQVSNHTIDLIVQACYKYRIISKRGRTLFGRQLMAANQQALAVRYGDTPLTWAEINEAYTFTPIARKFKRAAVCGAIHCFEVQAIEDPTYMDGEVRRLVAMADKKNARLAGFTDTFEYTYPDEDDEDGETTSVLLQSGVAAMREQNGDTWYDITEAQRDAESTDFAESVMVRPIDLILAERNAEAERIRAERMAQADAAHAAMARGDDDDEDDWDDVDDDLEDEDDDDDA